MSEYRVNGYMHVKFAHHVQGVIEAATEAEAAKRVRDIYGFVPGDGDVLIEQVFSGVLAEGRAPTDADDAGFEDFLALASSASVQGLSATQVVEAGASELKARLVMHAALLSLLGPTAAKKSGVA